MAAKKGLFYVFVVAAAFFITTQVFTPILQTNVGIDENIEVPEPGNLTFSEAREWSSYKQIQNIDVQDGALQLQDSTSYGYWISPTVEGSDYINILSVTSTVEYQGTGNNFTTIIRQSDNPSMTNASTVRTIYNNEGTFSYGDINSTRQKYFDVVINISEGSSTNSEYQYLDVSYENISLSNVSTYLMMLFYAFGFLISSALIILLVELW